eukprot:1381118-Amphidinium_carterae.1
MSQETLTLTLLMLGVSITLFIRHRQRHDTRPPWRPLSLSSANAAPQVHDASLVNHCHPLRSPDIDEVLAMGEEEFPPCAAGAASSNGHNQTASA